VEEPQISSGAGGAMGMSVESSVARRPRSLVASSLTHSPLGVTARCAELSRPGEDPAELRGAELLDLEGATRSGAEGTAEGTVPASGRVPRTLWGSLAAEGVAGGVKGRSPEMTLCEASTRSKAQGKSDDEVDGDDGVRPEEQIQRRSKSYTTPATGSIDGAPRRETLQNEGSHAVERTGLGMTGGKHVAGSDVADGSKEAGERRRGDSSQQAAGGKEGGARKERRQRTEVGESKAAAGRGQRRSSSARRPERACKEGAERAAAAGANELVADGAASIAFVAGGQAEALATRPGMRKSAPSTPSKSTLQRSTPSGPTAPSRAAPRPASSKSAPSTPMSRPKESKPAPFTKSTPPRSTLSPLPPSVAEGKLDRSDDLSSCESKHCLGDDSSVCSDPNAHPNPRAMASEAERPELDATSIKIVASLVRMGYIEAAAHAALRATMADNKPGSLSEQAQLDMSLEWLQGQAEAAATSKLRPQAIAFEAPLASGLASGLASSLPPEAAMALMARDTCSCPSSSSSSPTPPGTSTFEFAYLDAATGYMYPIEPPLPDASNQSAQYAEGGSGASPLYSPPLLYLDPMSDPSVATPNLNPLYLDAMSDPFLYGGSEPLYLDLDC